MIETTTFHAEEGNVYLDELVKLRNIWKSNKVLPPIPMKELPQQTDYSKFYKAEEMKDLKTWEGKLEIILGKIKLTKLIFSGPATICYWSDGTKTVVKCTKGDKFDELTGLSMCIMKKLYGDHYKSELRKAIKRAKHEHGDKKTNNSDQRVSESEAANNKGED